MDRVLSFLFVVGVATAALTLAACFLDRLTGSEAILRGWKDHDDCSSI